MKYENIIEDLKMVLEEKFATEVLVLEISKISTLGDYFIIATGKNENQIQAMAKGAMDCLHKYNLYQKHHEGGYNSGWALLDFGDIILHIFDETSRNFYNIERLWSDAIVKE